MFFLPTLFFYPRYPGDTGPGRSYNPRILFQIGACGPHEAEAREEVV